MCLCRLGILYVVVMALCVCVFVVACWACLMWNCVWSSFVSADVPCLNLVYIGCVAGVACRLEIPYVLSAGVLGGRPLVRHNYVSL